MIHVNHANGYTTGQDVSLDGERARIRAILDVGGSLIEAGSQVGTVIMQLDDALENPHVVGTSVVRLDAEEGGPSPSPENLGTANNINAGTAAQGEAATADSAASTGNTSYKTAGIGAGSLLAAGGAAALFAVRYRMRRRSQEGEEEELEEEEPVDGGGVVAISSEATLI
jgi:hypothetical protein